MNLNHTNGLPADFTWPNGARLALSLVVNVEEGAEMNIRDGDPGPEPVDELAAVPRKPIRVHGNESNYQYGIKAGAERVFRLLAERELMATMTAAALALERAPAVTQTIVDAGYEVAAHGYRWVHQFRMDEDDERQFIAKARDSIKATTGSAPIGWLSRYLNTEATQRLLVEEGFTYHMDDYSDDLPFWQMINCGGEGDDSDERPLLMMPYAMDTNDMKMWNAPALTARDWGDYALDTFDWLLRESQDVAPRMMSFGLHLRIVGRPGRIGALQRFLDHVAGRDEVWIASRAEIAKAYTDAVPSP